MRTRGLSQQRVRMTLALGLPVLSLIALCIALNVSSAWASTQNTTQAQITIGTTDNIVSLDPADSYDYSGWEILNAVGSGLLTYVPGTTDLVPGLATTLPEVSPDGLAYTFTLRAGLQFPDGTPFDASTVKWSIDRAAALGGGPSWYVTSFVSEVQVLDSTTVKFVLSETFTSFPLLMTVPIYFPVSPNCFPGDQFDATSICGGIGPYQIANWTQGTSMELEANPGYYGPPPKTSSITVRYFDSASDLRNALDAGGVDVAWRTLTPADYQELRSDPNFNVVEGSSSHIRFLCFNTTTPPFDNAAVRTALAAAVERESIAHNVYTDTMLSLYSTVPSGVWSHREAFFDLYGQRNLAEARTLLQQEGYSETHKLEMDLWYPPLHYGPLEPDLAAALATEIEESGMVSVTLHSTDWATYVGNLGAGTMPVFLLGWYPDWLDPDNYTWPFAHSSSSDDLGVFYNNPVMDNLLETGRATRPVQGPAREAIYVDIQELWAAEAPTIPLLQDALLAVTQERIRDVVISSWGNLSYVTMWRDTSVSETIGTAGGSLTSYDGNTTVQIPPEAITDTIVLTHTPTAGPSPSGNLTSIGRDFDLTAVYSDTGKPAQIAPGYTYTVSVQYSDTQLGPAIEATLGLYWWDDGAQHWSQQGITSDLDLADNLVTAQVDHFSVFALLGKRGRVYLPLVLKNH